MVERLGEPVNSYDNYSFSELSAYLEVRLEGSIINFPGTRKNHDEGKQYLIFPFVKRLK